MKPEINLTCGLQRQEKNLPRDDTKEQPTTGLISCPLPENTSLAWTKGTKRKPSAESKKLISSNPIVIDANLTPQLLGEPIGLKFMCDAYKQCEKCQNFSSML